jgi:hypothetical protein
MQIMTFSVRVNVLTKFRIFYSGFRLQKQISSLVYPSPVLVNVLTKMF